MAAATELTDLLAWAERQRDNALSQITLFTTGGVKATLQMPDGSTQEITEGVLSHQRENVAAFERLAAALRPLERGGETDDG